MLANVRPSGAFLMEDFYYAGGLPVVLSQTFRSLIHSAKDAQRQFNYWRSSATELVALAPRVPVVEAG